MIKQLRANHQCVPLLARQANTDGSVTANFGESTTWGNDDPSVFAVTIVKGLQGEYQICNGYGKEKATQVMNDHWSTYIVEDDFAFMAANGLNAVRIPVGWWIASDPNPPAPFVGGSLQALDNAFTWAERNNIRVIVNLHAAPGSQNPNEHSVSPPLCKWFHWIDTEQPDWARQEVEEKHWRAWETFFEEERQEKARANAKAERERQIQKLKAEQARNREVNQKRMDDEAARRFAEEEVRREAREAERKRLSERAAEAQAAEERGDKSGKWPLWTQGK
ncbi:hypothetical protein QYE76_019258 [Lolium multiflorum]|uniref:Glycoside hydrolase family 5 domain-containing protein n=1 Tax=Lolium multiflorum TaxID=4521 RepID=A0AAD8R3M9_LOLMU|nr:hypothetical protein QYE76_019258 [Lolium multiflorum]